MKSCPRCARQNEDDVRFCGRCGLDLVEYEQHQTRPNTSETNFCYRHPKEATNLSCGRCGKPICTKCAAIGPAGPRCPDCAKQSVTIRPAGVVHEAKRRIFSLSRVNPFAIYAAAFLLLVILGSLKGCVGNRPHTRTNVPEQSTDIDSEN